MLLWGMMRNEEGEGEGEGGVSVGLLLLCVIVGSARDPSE